MVLDYISSLVYRSDVRYLSDEPGLGVYRIRCCRWGDIGRVYGKAYHEGRFLPELLRHGLE